MGHAAQSTRQNRTLTVDFHERVVFQKWRWTEIAVITGPHLRSISWEGMVHDVHRGPLLSLSE